MLTDHPLAVAAANGTDVPFDGWIDVTLEVVSVNHRSVAVQVPMLVGQSCVSFPLLGSNVIVEIIKGSEQTDGMDISILLKEALNVSENTAKAIVSILSATVSDEEEAAPQYEVRVGKKGLTIPAGQVGEVRCRVRAWPEGGTRLYEPAVNNNCPDGLELFPALVNVPKGSSKVVKIPIQNVTKHEIFLSGRTILGTLEEVAEVKPVTCPLQKDLPVKQPTRVETCSAQISTEAQSQKVTDKQHLPTHDRWHPPVDFSHLGEKEQETVKKMLYEESDIFAKEEGDIGCIQDLN